MLFVVISVSVVVFPNNIWVDLALLLTPESETPDPEVFSTSINKLVICTGGDSFTLKASCLEVLLALSDSDAGLEKLKLTESYW